MTHLFKLFFHFRTSVGLDDRESANWYSTPDREKCTLPIMATACHSPEPLIASIHRRTICNNGIWQNIWRAFYWNILASNDHLNGQEWSSKVITSEAIGGNFQVERASVRGAPAFTEDSPLEPLRDRLQSLQCHWQFTISLLIFSQTDSREIADKKSHDILMDI